MRSYRTISTLPAVNCLGGVFSAALSVGSRPPGVTWHFTLRSPDFPPPNKSSGDCLANLRRACYLPMKTITRAFFQKRNTTLFLEDHLSHWQLETHFQSTLFTIASHYLPLVRTNNTLRNSKTHTKPTTIRLSRLRRAIKGVEYFL